MRTGMMLGVVCSFLFVSAATAEEPVRQVTYEHKCECTWQGYCDAESTVFKVVRYDKKPNYRVGCAVESVDRKWLRIHANKTCKASGFERFFEVDSMTCTWSAEPKTTWVKPKRQRSWRWVYRKRIARHRSQNN